MRDDATIEIGSRDGDAFMRRAIALAEKALGRTAPNPVVGCVIVDNAGRIVGEGWHDGPGTPHAEVAALAEAGDAAEGASVFVTLEPCNHKGNTGPCVDALINAKVGRVYYAVADPNPIAAGGAERLRAAGIVVEDGLCREEAAFANRAWLHKIRSGRPFVIAKAAMSLDGRIATIAGESQWITDGESRRAGHRIRRAADAIIVGAGTVITDDPALTARIDGEESCPLRVVLDSTGRTSPGAKTYERSGNGALLITTAQAGADRLARFRDMGVDVEISPSGEDQRPDPEAVLSALGERGVVTAMIEGGGAVLGAFFDADLIDELALFIAPKVIGGGGAPAFGGRGVATLGDAERFAFMQLETNSADFHLRGLRKKESH